MNASHLLVSEDGHEKICNLGSFPTQCPAHHGMDISGALRH